MLSKKEELIRLLQSYRYMYTSRIIDGIEEKMTSSGEAFFHVSGAGHEASAVLNHFLSSDDWLHCHYRDKALMLARGISIKQFLLSTLNKASSHSAGRQMNAHMSQRSLNIMSIVGPVGNNALQAVGVASVIRNQPTHPVVLCSMGDGTTQQGEVLEAIAHASRETLPVLFFIHDNSLAISTTTARRTFFSTPAGECSEFYGIPIHTLDGTNSVASLHNVSSVVATIRTSRAPQIVRFKVERLSHHTNADDQSVYRSSQEISAVQASSDPLTLLRAWLCENGKEQNITADSINAMEQEINAQVQVAADSARNDADPEPIYHAVAPLPPHLNPGSSEYRGTLSVGVSKDAQDTKGVTSHYTMLGAIRETLKIRMQEDESIELFGEDIEDPKGDVFGVTKGLSLKYPDRVKNSPLAEASIVGISIGRALAGRIPIAFLQFADFFPIAYNQIFSELGSMYWRTNGSWNTPLIIMITCGAYRPGLGPFHANTFESVAAHTPGIDVMMPTYAGDAAGLLNAALDSGRPTLYFYPKSLLNDRQRVTSTDVRKMIIPIGSARSTRTGKELTFVAWGNTTVLCEKVADTLANHNITSEVIDLRTIMPWDKKRVLDSVRVSKKLIICHEDNTTAGMGAEIAATVSENVPAHVDIQRVTRADTYIPCNFSNQIELLPSYSAILERAVEMLGGTISWKKDNAQQEPTVDAIGSSPSDESVTVIKWLVQEGDAISKGDHIADLEADKASVELTAPVDGVIKRRIVTEGESTKVGSPLLALNPSANSTQHKAVTQENPGTPVINFNFGETTPQSQPLHNSGATSNTIHKIGILGVRAKPGSRVVYNREFKEHIPQWTPEDIYRRTGIESRRWLDKGENSLSLAVQAAQEVMHNFSISIDEIGLIVCSTETPIHHTPSMATRIQNIIKGNRSGFLCPAYDINAACSGYLYALQIAYDFLQSEPTKVVLLVTAEELSKKIDMRDPATAPIFADASSATIVTSEYFRDPYICELFRPIIGADGEDGTSLLVPTNRDEFIRMNGRTVFSQAVKEMIKGLQHSCEKALINISDLARIVAHQANQRILDAVARRLKIKSNIMYSNIKNLGNTSSTSIPLCLSSIFNKHRAHDYIGLTAFGGGFTFGSTILKMVKRQRNVSS